MHPIALVNGSAPPALRKTWGAPAEPPGQAKVDAFAGSIIPAIPLQIRHLYLGTLGQRQGVTTSYRGDRNHGVNPRGAGKRGAVHYEKMASLPSLAVGPGC